MKRVLSLMLALMLVLSLVVVPTAVVADEADPYAGYDKWDGVTYDTTPFNGITANNGGNDVTGGPVIIDTAAKLAGFAKLVNDAGVLATTGYGAYHNLPIYITKNIDLGGHEFPSIGKAYNAAVFSGRLEGRLDGVEGVAPTIANFKITEPTANNIGFVGSLRGGAMKNLTFVDAYVGNVGNDGGVGIAVGYVSKKAEVSGLTVINSTLVASTKDSCSCGGVIGTIKNDIAMDLSGINAINVTIEANDTIKMVGGLVGLLQAKSAYNFSNCYFSGEIKGAGANTPAAMVGTFKDGSVTASFTNCQFNGKIENSQKAGVFVGNIAAGASLTLTNCLNTGSVAANAAGNVPFVGAAAGTMTYNAVNCYSTSENTVAGAGSSTITVLTQGNLKGDAARSALEGFDFAAAWAANAGALPTVKGIVDAKWTALEGVEEEQIGLTYDVWDGVDFAETFWAAYDPAADGTGKAPIVIDTAAKLAGLAKVTNDAAITGSTGAFKNQKIQVTANIDLNGYEFPTIGKQYGVAHFAGILEGNVGGEAAVIKNLKATAHVSSDGGNLGGFIGNLRGGSVKNFVFDNAVVGNAASMGGSGIVVGYASKVSEISNITVKNSTLIPGAVATDANQANGGIIGNIKTDNEMLVLENLTAINVKIPLSEGVYRVGGLVGRVQNTNYTFKNCYYSGQFEMDMVYAGGLMGLATYDLGGMLGYSEKAASVKFENCQFNGNIAFNPDMGDSGLPVLMGAFIGRVNNGALTFDKCLASGQMNVSFNMDDPNMVSAFRMIAKQEGTTAITVTDSYSNLLVKDSYNSAIEVIVTGTEFTGATVEGAFVVAAKCGLAIDETAKTALSGFDFENVWTVNKGGFATLKAAAGDTYATEKASVKVSTFAGAHEYTTRSPYDDAQHKKSCACGAYVLENHTLINNSGAIAIEGNTEQHQTAYCLCGYKKLENHNLTLEKIDGNADQHKRSCDVCGFDVVENHDHATLVKVDDNQHKKVCICGDEIAELENHIWDDGVVTKEATHLAEGSKLFTCACGATKTEVIEKIAEHNYKNIAKDGDNADQHKKFCACGEFVMEDHAFDEGKVTKAATHMEEGVTTYTCVCKATKTEAIEKIAEHTYECEEIEDNAEQHQKVCECGDAIVEDHTWEEKSNTPATHLAAGEIVYGCDACGATKSEEIEKIAEHSFDNGTVTKEATHTAEGEKTYKCACGETETETIAKLTNHTYNIVTNHNDEQHKKSCECGEYVLTKHSFGKGTVTTEATETTDGVMTYKCSGCDATKTEVIPAKGTQNKPEEDKTTEQKPEEKPADNKQPEAPTSSRSGCFGVISSTTLVAFLTVGLGAAVIRKKKED